MNHLEAQSFARLLHHLDGSIVADETDLMTDVEYLAHTTTMVNGLPITFDEDTLLDTLGQVAQRHADAEQYQIDYADDPR